ncbi:MAG: hypothetical protein OXT67_10985 [Zetaproteobacteria bacterium]|nr:hypothetical protein [Zetaproteobacteria bacterium]
MVEQSQWYKCLEQIVASPVLHHRWLSTLGQLEYVGAAKIAAFLPQWSPEVEHLQHAAEEFRHAFFFMSRARELGVSQSLPQRRYHYLRRYLHLLDAGVTRAVKAAWMRGEVHESVWKSQCYLWVTKLVEVRAVQLYQIYHQVLKARGLFSLQWLIREEASHLREIDRELERLGGGAEFYRYLQDMEGSLFLSFEKDVFSWVQAA